MRTVKVFGLARGDLIEQRDYLFVFGQQLLQLKLIRIVEAVDFVKGPVLVRADHFKGLSALS